MTQHLSRLVRIVVLCTLAISSTWGSMASAALAGKNVILVHGFQASDLSSNPNDAALQTQANNYWSSYWLNRAEEVLYWSSVDRVSGGIKDKIRSQVLAIARGTRCISGCVVVTHSTGDLVTRYMLRNVNNWLTSAGIDPNRFRILAVLDLAGAGGGTEIADLAVAIGNGSGFFNSLQRSAVELALGFRPDSNNLGVLYDLQPNTARNIATGNSAVPRLRFAGTGASYGGLTKPFIAGADDGVVPLHSACGASSKADYDSCSGSVSPNGVLQSVSAAPASLYFNNYVVLMGEQTNHGQAIDNSRSGNFTTVSNNRVLGGLNVDFDTFTQRKWWSFFRQVRWVRNGDSYSMSDNVFRTLN
ncbi:hypothetical protein [Allohahella marinimesophila]|uniref:Alpha/beta hydrolase n=1 Tax=Allohahella marinimesophila TaxID=1054972 RepID=A0ABP7PL35_9GAMM